MNVLLLGASGRIDTRIANELLNRGHATTGVSRSDEIGGVDDPDSSAIVGDATGIDQIARPVAGHDVIASAFGSSDGESPEVLVEMPDAVVDGIRRASVDRLAWTDGAGILNAGSNTRLIDSLEFPKEWKPVVSTAIETCSLLKDADNPEWTYIVPTVSIEPGEHTGEL